MTDDKTLPNNNTSLKESYPELYNEISENDPHNLDRLRRNSNILVLWKCQTCGKEYYCKIKDREVGDNKCPYCNKENINKTNNTIAIAAPELLDEWSDTNSIDPYKTSIKSTYYARWICPVCHREYSCYIKDKVPGNKNCPYCNSKDGENNKIENPFSESNPVLLKEWSSKNKIAPNTISADSLRSVLWECPTCHGTYYYPIKDRRVGDQVCPYCNGKEPLKDFNTLNITNPELAKEWAQSNKKQANEVLETSNEEVFWECPTCHGIYSYQINKRDIDANDCPYCNNKKPLKDYNTLNITHPELLDEWSSNNTIKPNEVLKSDKVSVLWICPTCKNEYAARVVDREKGDNICYYCNFLEPLKGFNTIADTRPEFIKDWSDKNIKRPDEITKLYTKPIIFECPDCHNEYTATIESKRFGDEACPYCNQRELLEGFNSLDITDPELAKEWSDNNELKPNEVMKNQYIYALWKCPKCHGEYRSLIKDREIDDDSCPYCNNRRPLKGFNTLEVTHPELAKEWSINNNIEPGDVLKKYVRRVLWKCPICQGEYYYSIRDREVGDNVCPYCNNKKPLKGFNTLDVTNPEVLDEWSYFDNYLLRKPDEILSKSRKLSWWICKECGNKYRLSPYDKLHFNMRKQKSCNYCKGLRRRRHYFFK